MNITDITACEITGLQTLAQTDALRFWKALQVAVPGIQDPYVSQASDGEVNLLWGGGQGPIRWEVGFWLEKYESDTQTYVSYFVAPEIPEEGESVEVETGKLPPEYMLGSARRWFS